jgi:hypothetical protein
MVPLSLENGQRLSEQERAETSLRVDLLRRANWLEDARQLLVIENSAISEGIIRDILALEE